MPKIVVVRYELKCEENGTHFTRSTSEGAKEYEYLAPDDAKGTEKYAVVCPNSSKINNAGSLKIVSILRWKELSEQDYPGDIKSVVDVVDTERFVAQAKRLAEKQALLGQIEKKLSERTKIAQLEAMAGSDKEALDLLERFKAL